MEPGVFRSLPTKIGIGIDFGMTYSGAAISYFTPDGEHKVERIQIKGEYGRAKFPTQVFVPEDSTGKIDIGYTAISQHIQESNGKLFNLFKRYLGVNRSEVFGGRTIDPIFLTIQVLKEVKSDVDDFLDRRGFNDSSIEKSYVFSYPGKWPLNKQEVFKEAIRGAGFSNFALIEEPIATAIAASSAIVSAKQRKEHRVEGGQSLLVCDIGGGTLDIAVVAITDLGEVRMKAAVGGDALLGMSNIDKFIALMVCGKDDLLTEDGKKVIQQGTMHGTAFESAWQDMNINARLKSDLLRKCEIVKLTACDIWNETEHKFYVKTSSKGEKIFLDLNTDIKPILEQMRRAIQESIKSYLIGLKAEQGIDLDDIGYVVIGGGGSALPNLNIAINELLPRAQILPIDKQWATSFVQCGAATFALKPASLLDRRVNASYGIKAYRNIESKTWKCTDVVEAERDGHMVKLYAFFDVFMKKGRLLREEVERPYTPMYANQLVAHFVVLRGEEEDPALNEQIGALSLSLPKGAPLTYEVVCKFKMNEDGFFDVFSFDPQTGNRTNAVTFKIELQPED